MTGRPARPPRQPLSRRRTGALAAGLLLTIAALLPPVSGMAEYRLSLHMALEMGLHALAIPLVAYGAAPLLARSPVANL